MRSCSLLLLSLLSISSSVLGANPIVPNVGMADPHVHFWPDYGKFFLYGTHDFSANNTNFLMKDWWIWSSPDLVEWTLEDVLEPEDTPAPQSAYNECWATDGATKNGSYFFYLSIGPTQVAVVNASSPTGPWQNALRQPLLTDAMGQALNPTTQFRDPCVFQDDDGSHYIIAGVFNYYIMRLGEDLMSLAEKPQFVHVINPTGPYGSSTDDKPFIHKYNGTYYLSWGCFYATSKSVYGPYTYVGSAIDTDFIAPDFRTNQTSGPWYSHEDYMDRHGSFFSAHNQWYYASNDRSHSTDTSGQGYFRDTVIGYVHFFPNNTMAPVVINGLGVNSHSANARIEAEEFFSLLGAHKGFDEESGFAVHGIQHGAELVYTHITDVSETTSTVYLRIANEQPLEVSIWIFSPSPSSVSPKSAPPSKNLVGHARLGGHQGLQYTTLAVPINKGQMPLPSHIEKLGIAFASPTSGAGAASTADLARLDSFWFES